MAPSLRPSQLTFRAKILVPVVFILVVLAVVPMFLVAQRMSHQLESSTAESLRSDDAVFRNLQAMQVRNLLVRYRNVPNEPRFKAVMQISDPKTLRVLLSELLEELGGDAALFVNQENQALAFVGHNPQLSGDKFFERSARFIGEALDGQPTAGMINVGPQLLHVASIPVEVSGHIVGSLSFGDVIDQAEVQEFSQLTRGEVVLLAGTGLAGSTLQSPDLASELRQAIAEFNHDSKPANATSPEGPAGRVLVNGQHYVYSIGHLNPSGSAEGAIGYILLSSYEKPLRVLQSTHQTFFWIQVFGILAGTILVGLLVNRVTRPLRQLRDSAEAVSQGDFSRQVKVESQDECGKLAAMFNTMTSNLKVSREELEKTVDRLKSTQAQLVQSEKLRAMGTLAGGIAHDFNNILGAIIGFTELVFDDVPAQSQTAENLRRVLKASQRAKDLVRQILAFSRRSEPQRVPVRLGSIVEETFKLLRASLPSTIDIQTRIHASGDTVIADPTQLHQVLMNLGTNAGHAMRQHGGLLHVNVDQCLVPTQTNGETPELAPGTYFRLSVTDTGHGMSPEVIERIFEPFFTTKPVGEGTGLGLSVVHGIIKDHGGEITVTSRPGHGTTFKLYLPAAQPRQFDTAFNADGPVPGAHERIMVVDDEEPLANMMQQRLSRLGYDVVAFPSSAEALKQFQSAPSRFDLVITDRVMPQLTGDALARELQRVQPDIPVILCSGSGPGTDLDLAQSSATFAFVSKPVDFTELSKTIRRVLQESKSNQPRPRPVAS